MIKLNSFPDRALELVSELGEGLKHAIPNGAGKWLETGAKLGALKTGTRIAGTFVRRNPAVTVAAAVGAGLLWYVARRKAKQAQNGPIEGSATRIEAKRSNGGTRSGTRTRTASKRTTRSRASTTT